MRRLMEFSIPMQPAVDPSRYGSHLPKGIVRWVLALTRRLPANWLGLRLSMPLRRLAIDWLGDRSVDTMVWGMRARLYPQRNACEKYALFTPQLFDPAERALLAAALDRKLAADGTFAFVDIGANVGLYSLFVAARGGARARVLAIEPQPGIVDRLKFNVAANPQAHIIVAGVAVADREGNIALAIDTQDSGGTRLHTAPAGVSAPTVRVFCRPLAAILADAGITHIDA